jgi:hypothetical protein
LGGESASAPEPHFLGRGRFQPPNVANASLLETYGFHSSHSLRRSQPKINDSSIGVHPVIMGCQRVYPAQVFTEGWKTPV